MATINVRLQNLDHIDRNLRSSVIDGMVRRIVTKAAVTGENVGKIAAPVDTGRLRASMTHQVSGRSGWFGTNVEYAERLDQPKFRNYRYRRGPLEGNPTRGWLTKRAVDATVRQLDDFIDQEVRRLEARWRT